MKGCHELTAYQYNLKWTKRVCSTKYTWNYTNCWWDSLSNTGQKLDTSWMSTLLCRVDMPQAFWKLCWRERWEVTKTSTSSSPGFSVSHPQQGQIPHCCMSNPALHVLWSEFNKHQYRSKTPIFTQNWQPEKKTALITIAQYGWCALWGWNGVGYLVTNISCKIWH